MNMEDNKSIKCDVNSCLYNDTACAYCTLDEIKVSCNANHNSANKKETICDSFKEKQK